MQKLFVRSVVVSGADDDVPTIEAIAAAIGDYRALFDFAVLDVPTEREAVTTAVDADDL